MEAERQDPDIDYHIETPLFLFADMAHRPTEITRALLRDIDQESGTDTVIVADFIKEIQSGSADGDIYDSWSFSI